MPTRSQSRRGLVRMREGGESGHALLGGTPQRGKLSRCAPKSRVGRERSRWIADRGTPERSILSRLPVLDNFPSTHAGNITRIRASPLCTQRGDEASVQVLPRTASVANTANDFTFAGSIFSDYHEVRVSGNKVAGTNFRYV